jgi:hypothetical protein
MAGTAHRINIGIDPLLIFAHNSKTPKQRAGSPGFGNLPFRHCKNFQILPPRRARKEQKLGLPIIHAQHWPRGTSVPPRNSAVNQVPLIRYFFLVGSLLLAMLFLTDGYWADASSPFFTREARVDKSIIRIRSAHKWPESIVFDTTQPTIMPRPLPLQANAPVADQRREAFAQLKQPSQQVSKPAPPKARRKLARRVPATRVAAYPAAAETWAAHW